MDENYIQSVPEEDNESQIPAKSVSKENKAT